MTPDKSEAFKDAAGSPGTELTDKIPSGIDSGKGKIPPGAMQRLRARISEQAREPWKRLEPALPADVEARTELNAARLCLKYTFCHKDMKELGHIRAIYTGDGLSLSKLLCGIRDAGDGFKDEREAMMLGIYETAKAAFGEGRAG